MLKHIKEIASVVALTTLIVGVGLILLSGADPSIFLYTFGGSLIGVAITYIFRY